MADTKKHRILVVDDDPRYGRLLKVNLEASGYAVTVAQDGQTAINLAAGESPDLILLDVMMPAFNGYTVCEKIREFSTAPIIMLTALGETDDKVKGLDLGADDYITKPVSIKEVLARIHAALRRSQMGQTEYRPALEVGRLRVDFVARRVYVADKEVELTPTEYRVLVELVTHAGHVLSSSYLLEKIWGTPHEEDTHLVWQVIHRLRHKIESDSESPHYIHTRPGVGYVFVPTGEY
ncbi:MAG TPA: response regulator transcription factor [Anaerolineae bacterium]|nr:response regulator transcription factor [Anaerolineae bacterium]HQK12874.1 response regulator transcription factor [Anaerolineae bacterium]